MENGKIKGFEKGNSCFKCLICEKLARKTLKDNANNEICEKCLKIEENELLED